MKRLLTLLFCISMFYHVKAQLPDGAIAPDFTMTDINGTVHNLYTYLEQGKTVILDFSATWCGPCWNYHNTHALGTFYDTYGPNGTNQAVVLFIEADGNTALECLYGNCPGTQGNWVAGTTYPIINDHTSNNAYNINFFPTIYGICQNYKIFEIGQLQAAGLQAFMENCSILSYEEQIAGTNCFGEATGSISLSVNTGVLPYTYNWSNGSSGTSISNLLPGTYYCTITAGDNTFLVTSPLVVPGPAQPLTSSISEVNNANCGQNNGSASVVGSGGTQPYSYQWSNGSTISAILDLPPGIYTVTINDGNACGAIFETIEISSVPAPEAIIAPVSNLDCNNIFGSIDGSASSGGPQFSFAWSTFDGIFFSGTETLNPQIGGPGTYSLLVTDNQYGCTSETFVTVEADFNEPEVSFVQSSPTIPCGETSVQLQAQVNNPSNQFFVQWTTQNGAIQSGANTLTPTVTQAGTYTIKVEYVNTGCYTEQNITVIQSAEFAVTAVTTPELCADQNNGSINVQVNGGSGPFNFNWAQNGVTGQNPVNLAPGQYTVSVSDNNGCQTVSTYTIQAASSIDITSTVENETDAGASDGSIIVNATGGSGNYTYSWSNGATTVSLNNVSAGVYQLTITDSNGCSEVFNIAVSNAGCAISATASVVEPKCSDSADGSVTLNVQNGGNDIEAIWPDGLIGLERNDLAAGSYNVIIEDESGCPLNITVEVTAPEAIQATVLELPEFECAGEDTDSKLLSINTNGGTGELNIVWNHGLTGNEIMVTYGSYSAIITDESGCTSTFNVNTLSADKEAPVIATNEVTIYLDEDGNAELDAQMIDGGTTDNCGEVVLSVSPSVFDCASIGENETIFKASDLSGNASEAVVTVKIIDNLPPTIICPNNIIATPANRIINYALPAVDDNCDIVDLEIINGLLPGNPFPMGVTHNSFIATDASGNTAVCNFTVTINRWGTGVIVPDRGPKKDEVEFVNRNSNPQDNFDFQAWPNPVASTLFVSLKNMYSGATISLMHISGKLMLHNVSTSSEDQILEIPVNHLVSGMYFIQIIENGTSHKQLIQISK